MIAIHDQFTDQLRNRLKTTCMGLGLVRLLQDARRFDEARTMLCWLEEALDKPIQKPAKAKRTRRTASRSSGSIRIDAA